MTQLCRCACCAGALEPAQQLRFLVETDNLDNPAFLNRIRMMPAINGLPVPVCKACQANLETAPQALAKPKEHLLLTTSLLGALGVLSIGLFLGALLAPRA